jgi:hypothetical protein
LDFTVKRRGQLGTKFAPGRRNFDLEERLLEFASVFIHMTETLPSSCATNHLAGQLLDAGSSPYGDQPEEQG